MSTLFISTVNTLITDELTSELNAGVQALVFDLGDKGKTQDAKSLDKTLNAYSIFIPINALQSITTNFS